ncbi:MAG: RAMP superfamily protein [Pseudonocardiales bacterium]|nr:MAG: RAMP superfamily protein [Pseudonocardiales bacterium]
MTEPLRFTIRFRTPFHVARAGAAEGMDSLVDRDVLLPSTSLKGRMRAEASALLGARHRLVAAVFGDRSHPSPWAWTDAHVHAPQIGQAARIRVDDDTGTADGGFLMFGEQVWAREATYSVACLARLAPEVERDQRLVLRAAARGIVSLGGSRRRGQGWVSISDGDDWPADGAIRLVEIRTATS